MASPTWCRCRRTNSTSSASEMRSSNMHSTLTARKPTSSARSTNALSASPNQPSCAPQHPREDRRVRRERSLSTAAEQITDRSPDLFTDKVVQGHIDGRERMNTDASAPRVERGLIQSVPHRAQSEWIGSHHQRAEIAAPDVTVRLLNEGSHELGRRVRLADALATRLVRHAHNDRVRRAVTVRRVELRRDDRDDLEVGNEVRAHSRYPSVGVTGPRNESIV